jgi:hypothetical protein
MNLSQNNKFFSFFIWSIFWTSLLLFFRYQFYLLSYKEWPDESDTIVTAKLVVSGLKLYSEIGNIHGPLTFAPSIILEKISSFGIQGHRAIIVGMQFIALLSTYYSPVLKNKLAAKFFVIFLIGLLCLVFPKFYGHTYIYQNIAGIFAIIILVQYLIPSIINSNSLRIKSVVIGNILISALPFLGIIYLPASILFFLSSIQKKYIQLSLMSLLLGISFNLLFIWTFGSFLGFYVQHYYINAYIMPLFDPGHWPITPFQMLIFALKASTKNLAGFISLLVLLILIINLLSKEKIFYWKSLLNWRLYLLIAAIGSFLIRGSDLHALPYYYSMSVIPIFLFKDKNDLRFKNTFYFIPILFLLMFKLSLFSQGDRAKLESKKIPDTTEFSSLVMKLTDPNDKIIAYSFQPYEYIASKRLPASGDYSYFPQIEKYNENPIYGIEINGCKDIKKNKPKIMMVDKKDAHEYFNVKFAWESYGSCIQSILDKDYIQIQNKPFYIRKDIFNKFNL